MSAWTYVALAIWTGDENKFNGFIQIIFKYANLLIFFYYLLLLLLLWWWWCSKLARMHRPWFRCRSRAKYHVVLCTFKAVRMHSKYNLTLNRCDLEWKKKKGPEIKVKSINATTKWDTECAQFCIWYWKKCNVYQFFIVTSAPVKCNIEWQRWRPPHRIEPTYKWKTKQQQQQKGKLI